MKAFFLKLIFLFVGAGLVALLYLNYSHIVISKVMGPPTKEQIRKSFYNALNKNYKILILGSSRPYRGINPEKLSVPAYNFAHDNDSFNQAYYKLKYLQDRNKKPEYLVLGVDYFSFSYLSGTRNYAYAKYFDRAYLADFEKETSSVHEKAHVFDSNFNNFMELNITATTPLFFAGLSKIIKNQKVENLPFHKDNGQYVIYGHAKPNDVTKSKAKILPIQIKYYNMLMATCKEDNIKVIMVMLPSRSNELNSFTPAEKDAVESIYRTTASVNNFFYLNYAADNRFSMADFTDITHLNHKAADKFSTILNQDLKNYLQ